MPRSTQTRSVTARITQKTTVAGLGEYLIITATHHFRLSTRHFLNRTRRFYLSSTFFGQIFTQKSCNFTGTRLR
ncbi:MAG: hypothetical protein F6K32_26205 [Desertifilum sp. SIO1I2]|nr:hypothetical protein [Desertifilum sp. SIO1I2]